MPQLTPKKKKIIHMDFRKIFAEANRYIWANGRFVLCVCVVNMVYMLCLKAIPDGIQNPISIVWFVTYYIFWCFFYRYYYGLKPYFFSNVMLGSLAPSTKALFIFAALLIGIALLPMLPLFLGFDDVYMDIYERYLQPATEMAARGEKVLSGAETLVVYALITLLAPILICKPYLAWIASLRGQNASFRKVSDKIKGNYGQFVVISACLLFPEALFTQLDYLLNTQHWLDYTGSTILFIYTNIVFAKIYDFFYLKH
ncbi:MAG: hypothetical protein IKN71_00415 [Alphaproteobacteria bacterium]|nr:hypothetical protein [Alphaproteobacteria bacterium]